MQRLNKWGMSKVYFFYNLSKKKRNYSSVKELFNSKIIYIPIFLSFLTGFIFTFPIVYFEISLYDNNLYQVFSYFIIMLISVFLEFYFLFLLGFATLAYYTYHIYQINKDKYGISEDNFLSSLVLTVMELPAEKIINYNLNPYEYVQHRVILFSLIYKGKVMMTNFVAKFILKKVLSRTALRGYSAFIAMPITGLWDAIIFHSTISKSKYKIIVRIIILILLKDKLNILKSNVKLILYRYYYFGEYSNNLDFLLSNIYKNSKFFYSKEEYLNLNILENNQKLLAILFSFKESSFSPIEKDIMKKNKIFDDVKALKKHIKYVELDSIRTYIEKI